MSLLFSMLYRLVMDWPQVKSVFKLPYFITSSLTNLYDYYNVEKWDQATYGSACIYIC